MSSVAKLCSVPPWYCSSIIHVPSTPSPYAAGRTMRVLVAIQPPSPAPPPMPNSPSSTLKVIGAVVGCAAVLILAIFICLYCWKLKKSRQQVNLMRNTELLASPVMDKGDLYAKTYQEPQHPPPAHHVIKLSSETDLHPIPAEIIPMELSDEGPGTAYSDSEPHPPYSPRTFGMPISTFTYNELVIATEGFSGANFLGEGGFGYVHKGVLPNGVAVAVKQLKTGSRQGEREFRAEVEIISRVHHKHLVSLVGYCISNDHRLLVYEFLPNSTLEFHLHAQGRPTVEWPTRLKIALGSAKGLAYLHEDCHPKIIHRDIKSANILIDYKFEAKVSDFGLAKLTEDNKSHVSTRVMGTFGYLAPEYASSGKITEKSDVFSFGVMLLELITGRRPVDMTQSSASDSLVDWARPLLMHATKHGNYEQLVDPKLGKNYKENEMARMIICAAACVLNSAKSRPSMSQVVHALEGNTLLISDLIRGLKQSQSQYISSYTNSGYDTSYIDYNKAIKEFREIEQQSNQSQSSQYTSSEHQETMEMEMGTVKEPGQLPINQ